MFTKQCPLCGKEILYSSYKTHWQAIKRNSVCKSCRTIIANKSDKRDTGKSKNNNWKGYEEIPYNWFSNYYIRQGKKYPKSGDVTIQQVWGLYLKQDKLCALSRLPIGWYDDGKTHTASLDRIDSNEGYYLDNLQLVHKDVNIMKNRYDQQYFINICKKVTENYS
jgi:hypothetical protein